MRNIAVFCFLEFENRLLLVKKNYDNKSWTLPGGAVDVKEGVEDALRREVLEETGQTIDRVDFVASFYSKEHYSIALCFQARLHDPGEIVFNSREIADAAFFEPDNLPRPMSPRYQFWIETYQKMKTSFPKNLFQYG